MGKANPIRPEKFPGKGLRFNQPRTKITDCSSQFCLFFLDKTRLEARPHPSLPKSRSNFPIPTLWKGERGKSEPNKFFKKAGKKGICQEKGKSFGVRSVFSNEN